MKERKKVIREIDWLMKTYCDGCFLRSTFRKEHGKKFALSFCNKKCTVGTEIQSLGEQLQNIKKEHT